MEGESIIGYQFSIIGDELMVMIYRLSVIRHFCIRHPACILHPASISSNRQLSTVNCQLSSIITELFIVARTMTFPFVIKIDSCHYLGFVITLCKHDADMLIIVGHSFHSISGAWPCVGVAFPIIDVALAHNFFYF